MESRHPKDINFDNWITQQKLASELGIKIQRINNWVARGKIDAVLLKYTDTILVDKKSIKIKKFTK